MGKWHCSRISVVLELADWLAVCRLLTSEYMKLIRSYRLSYDILRTGFMILL